MGKEILTFGDIETEKNKFYRHESPIFSEDVAIEKVLVSNKISFGEKNYKYFTGYLYDDYKVKPLYIMFPKTSAYVKSYDEQTGWIYFLIKDDAYWKNIILFRIMSLLVFKKNLIATISTIKIF